MPQCHSLHTKPDNNSHLQKLHQGIWLKGNVTVNVITPVYCEIGKQALRLFTRQRQGHNYLSNILEDNDLYLSDNLKKK